MATLNRLQGYGSEVPPPYELSHSMEDMVRDLEDRLQDKEHELRQMRRNLDESEDAIAQVSIFKIEFFLVFNISYVQQCCIYLNKNVQ